MARLTVMLPEGCMEELRGLTEGFERLEEAMARLAKERACTEAALQRLARQCETLLCDIEEIAYIVLHDALKREVCWQVGVVERTWQQWNSQPTEFNDCGGATEPAQP